MSKIDLLLKIGGSVLTDKKEHDIINYSRIGKIAVELHKIYEAGQRFAIVTGVGNVGHRSVAKHGIHHGDDGSISRRLGLVEAQIKVNNLRNTILKAMKEAKVPVVQFYASSIAISDGNNITEFHLNTVASFIESGLIPVISGDIIPNTSIGYSVLSGDMIFAEIAKQWQPNMLIYGTDVDGIYDKDPKHFDEANLIEKLNINDMNKIETGEVDHIDVTEAMQGKLDAIKLIFEQNPNIEVEIINLTDTSNLSKLLDNEDFPHTTITAK